jgi:hypothetical protein
MAFDDVEDQAIASAPAHGANATSPWWGRWFVGVRYEFTMGLIRFGFDWFRESRCTYRQPISEAAAL